MDPESLDRQAILTSPQVQADNHAFAAIIARACGTAGPKMHRDDDASDAHVIRFSVHRLEETNR